MFSPANLILSSRPLAAALLAVSLTGVVLVAQDPERTKISASTRAQGTQPDQAPRYAGAGDVEIKARNFIQLTDPGDDPDYAPTIDVLDKSGNVVTVKQIGNPYVLAFTGGSYTPPRGIDPDLRRTLLTRPNGHTYGFVMIRGRMAEEKMARLKQLGLTLLGVHTWQCVKARVPSRALPALANLPFVQWVGYARRSQKIDHNLAPVLAAAADGEALDVIINPFESDWNKDSRVEVVGKRTVLSSAVVDAEEAPSRRFVPNGRFQKGLEEAGLVFGHYNQIVHAFHGQMTKAQILRLLEKDWVHSVEVDHGMPELFHDQEITMVQQDYMRRTYSGKGINVGIVDTGIDATPWHKDLANKSYVGFNSATVPFSDHGTHVAGTIFGSGAVDLRYQGAAPGVGTNGGTNRIFVQKLGSAMSTIATNMSTNYKDAKGATTHYPRVICNSYGSLSALGFNGTESNARTVDQVTFNHGQLWVFASGNTKETSNMWCTSPGSAKNALTVGSVTDKFNWSRTTQPGDKSGFSRWGTTDGRIKPEIMAPGEDTTSCQWNSATGYVNKKGTSMSTPLITGCLASKIQASTWMKDKPEALRAKAVATGKNYNQPTIGKLFAPQAGKSAVAASGFGLFNARHNFGNSADTQSKIWTGTFTKSLQTYDSGAFTVPSNAEGVRVVVCFTEPAASSSALQARISDVRAYLDFAPYTSSSTAGDVAVASGSKTLLAHTYYAISSNRRGKPARLKVHGKFVVSSKPARWAVVVYFYIRGAGGSPQVTATGSATPIKPGATYTLTGTMASPSTRGEFRSGRMWYEGGFSLNAFSRKTEDNVTQLYGSGNTHPSLPFPRVQASSSGGMVVGAGRSRKLDFYLRAPTTKDGLYGLKVMGTYDTNASPSPLLSSTKIVCVDGQAPYPIYALGSTSHLAGQWSNKSILEVFWRKPRDQGCADMGGLAYLVTTSTVVKPPTKITVSGAPISTRQTVAPDSSSGYYFYIRPMDKAGNWGSVSRIGPFKIDRVRPITKTVSLDGGAASTSNLKSVHVSVTATDERSGLAGIRYSAGKWSVWMPFATNRKLDLTTLGATTAFGTKTVYVQVRDKAGNTSNTALARDSITYRPALKLSSVTASNYNITKGYYLVRGVGLTAVNLVQFGSSAITKQWTSAHEDDWWVGRYRVVSDTELRIYPPQNLKPGSYGVRVRNTGGTYSNPVSTKVAAWTATSNNMETQTTVTAGRNQYILAALGKNPLGTTQITMISTVQKPSVLPGLLTMSIGNNWTDYLLLPKLGFDLATGNSGFGAQVPASAKGFSVYFQTAFLAPNTYPLPVSKVHRVSYK